MADVMLSEMRLQEVRKTLEGDYGKGSQATIIVQNSHGEIVLFISGGSAEEIEAAIRALRQKVIVVP